MADQVFVQVVFEAVHPRHGTFRDALTFPISEYLTLTADQLEAQKQERFDNWVVTIETPAPTPVELGVDPVAAALDAVAASTEALRQAQEALAAAAAPAADGE